MKNENKWKAQSKSRAKIYEQYALKTRREYCVNGRLEKAANDRHMSKNAYLLYALEKQLSLDGYGRETINQEE